MRRFIPNGRPFRFSLLGLLVMVTLAAGVAGWIAYHLDWIRQREAVLARGDLMFPLMCGMDEPSWEPPPWPLAWLGAEPVMRDGLYLPDGTSDAELRRVERLFPEKYVTRLGDEPPWEP